MSVRVANDADLNVLDAMDAHLSRQDLASLVGLGRILLAEVDGTASGLLRWSLFWDQVPFMNLLFVVPDRRERGIGTALVDAWEQRQVAAGHTLVLTSTSVAETSQHLYRRLGYVDSGSLLLPGEPAELILRKHLDS